MLLGLQQNLRCLVLPRGPRSWLPWPICGLPSIFLTTDSSFSRVWICFCLCLFFSSFDKQQVEKNSLLQPLSIILFWILLTSSFVSFLYSFFYPSHSPAPLLLTISSIPLARTSPRGGQGHCIVCVTIRGKSGKRFSTGKTQT